MPDDRLLPGTSEYRRLNWAMLAAGTAAFGMLYSTQALLPQISETFDISAGTAALTVSAGTGGLALAVIAATWAGERVGRVRLMRAGLAIAVAAQLLSVLMPTFELLVAFRIVVGVALSAVVGVAMGHVGAEVHPSGLARAMGLYVAGNSLGGVAGRFITAGVSEFASWQTADAVLGVCAGLAAVTCIALLPPSRQETGRNAPQESSLAVPRMWVLALVPFTLMGAFVAVYNYLTYRLTGAPFNLSNAVVGMVFAAYLAGTASSVFAGTLVSRWGRPAVMSASMCVMLLGIAITLADSLAAVVAGLMIFTAGFFGAHATASGWMPVVAHGVGPRSSGVYLASYYAGSSIFGAALGWAWMHGGWWATVAGVLALIAGAGVATWWVARTSPEDRVSVSR